MKAGSHLRPQSSYFENRRELGPVDWMPPLMGFGHMAVYAVHEIYRPELFAAFWPETRHPPLPE